MLSLRVLGDGGSRRVEREPHERLRWKASPEGIGGIVSRQTRVATALALVNVVIVGLPLLVAGPSGPVRYMALAVLVALVIVDVFYAVLVTRREPTLRLRRSVRNTVSALVICNLVALAVAGLVVTAVGLHLDTSVNGWW
jgi:hypothetical protein